MSSSRVLIVQAMCKQYRAPLFARMYEELLAEGIELHIAYSPPVHGHRARRDDVDLPPAYGLRVIGRPFFGGKLFSQLPFRAILHADLVIVEHAVKHLVNYPLLLLSGCKLKKLGFWVHGGSVRHGAPSLARSWRTWSMLAADWIFAYTKGVAGHAVDLGVNPDHVTALENAIELSGFRSALAAITPLDLTNVRAQLGMPDDARVALFCGSLYPGRGIDFLVAAGDQVAAREPRFHMVVLGAGPLQEELKRKAATRSWLHCLGSIFGDERALYFRLAHVCLMPYLAGLGILDAMAAGLPYLVTGARATNPEIEYLQDGVTGVVTGDSVSMFATCILELVADTDRLHTMAEAARAASLEYSIEAMSANFCRGIRTCLAEPAQL